MWDLIAVCENPFWDISWFISLLIKVTHIFENDISKICLSQTIGKPLGYMWEDINLTPMTKEVDDSQSEEKNYV